MSAGMRIPGCNLECSEFPGAVDAWRATVDAAQWLEACRCAAAEGGRLVSLWSSDYSDAGKGMAVHAALVFQPGLVVVTLPVADGRYPDISAIFPAANRMQRAVHDLMGLAADGAADDRRWLRHAAWGPGEFPLRKDFAGEAVHEPAADDYPFVQVAGDGVHEIPVGPVHAGTIEPGHFRFSVVGERVLRLEERLGYTHKGIEKRFEQLNLPEGARLAGRISGDSTVAYAWAYAMAVEGAAGVTPPARAQWLRALWLERERVVNHLGDLGFLGNDAALSFGLTHFLRLKEDWLRTHRELFGHRYLMDAIVPGGAACDIEPAGMDRIRRELALLGPAVKVLRSVYDEHAGLQDRFIACGRVAPDLAARLGLVGLAGRASSQAWDLRVQHPCVPYRELDVQMAIHRNGDVAARAIVRFDEIFESLRLMRLMLDRLPLGDIAVPVPEPREGASGVGWVEGWRGEVFVALEAGAGNAIRRLHPHDPSWQNWPVLEHAVMDNIVPDFPLINKSFNLSYSGHDL
jgi:Ni,Fe-hydrogenase III large subunit/Ni,Fe-hydrogenase III component G